MSCLMCVPPYLVFQSNLALSPAALLPSPKSPGLRLQPPGFSPNCPSSPVSPTPGADKKEEESPASFESPADGALLPSINKVRVKGRRLVFTQIVESLAPRLSRTLFLLFSWVNRMLIVSICPRFLEVLRLSVL